jgi:hypothetical protein
MKYDKVLYLIELGNSETLLEIEQFCLDQKSSFSPSSTVLFLGCHLFGGASELNAIESIEGLLRVCWD